MHGLRQGGRAAEKNENTTAYHGMCPGRAGAGRKVPAAPGWDRDHMNYDFTVAVFLGKRQCSLSERAECAACLAAGGP